MNIKKEVQIFVITNFYCDTFVESKIILNLFGSIPRGLPRFVTPAPYQVRGKLQPESKKEHWI
ncbi:MAG TPA: hypothetical protein PKV48_06325, partial [Thermodesulfobacteriota bacterium]|nr:hypothetical protein [Thermodesulfobacteriota bacterium]